MISLKKKIETAVRMGANCGSLDLTSDDTKTSIDLDDADIQALHDGLCDTEKLAFRVRLAEVDADRESWRLLAGERMDERDALRAQVAEMGSGVPVAWGIEAMGEIWRISTNKGAVEFEAKPGSLPVVPLFRAANHAQAAELAAKVEALGAELAREKRMREETRLDLVKMISDRDDWKKEANSYDDRMFKVEQERDKWREQATTSTDKALSLQARVDTLTAGERLTKDALAAAEKRAEKAEFERDSAVSGRTSAQHLLKYAEARVRVLEGDAVPAAWMGSGPGRTSFFDEEEYARRAYGARAIPLYRHPPKTGEPVAWDVVGDDGMAIACDDEIHADKVLDEHGGRKRALYEAPPPAAIVVDVSEIRTLIEHGKQGCYDLSSFVIVLGNMLDKLPTVDVQTIRETCVTGKTAVEKWGKGAVDFVQFLDVILAAIGEKGG